MANIPPIKLAPDVIAQVGPFPITNAFLGTLLTSLIIIVLAVLVRRKAGVKPSRLQVGFEVLMEFMYDKIVIAFGDEKSAKKFFPFIFTMFLFFLVANQFALIPFVESIQTADGVQIFRTPASHYSLPIVLTILVLVISHLLALFIAPLRHIGNYIKLSALKIKSIKELPMAFLEIFLGLLDIIGEFAKLASLSTRLFGNMFAGGIIILIISNITTYTQFIAPLPFLLLSMLAGLVQAFVFAMLSVLYISQTVNAVKSFEPKTN